MPVVKLKEYLDREGVKYVTINHSLAYTAQEIAASAHIPGKELAKVVVVKLDGRTAMAILPATRNVELEMLKQVAGASNIALAAEREFQDMFPGCGIGAMPPFGNLYQMDVFTDDSLAQNEEIAFNAGSHTELIRMAYRDFERLVKPKAGKFSSS